MKVAFVLSNFPPEIRAGTELVAATLGEHLLAMGHRVLVICASERPHRGQDVLEEEYRGIQVRRLCKHQSEWDQANLVRPRLQALVAGILSGERPDVVHVHHFAGLGVGVLPAAAALGIPGLLTLHDVWVTCPRFFRMPPPGITCPEGALREECVACVNQELGHHDLGLVREAVHGRDRQVRGEVAAARVLTAPSRTAARMVAEHLPWDGPIEVIPHGLLRPAPPDERAAPPRAGGPLRIGTFGNLTEPKGVLDLVRAMAGLPGELHLHGAFLDPVFADTVEREARTLGVPLLRHGPYGEGQRHPAADLHLAVFPSRCQETYGLVIDEALARGLPVVVGDRGAFGERQGQPGVVVTPLPDLARCLRELLTAPGRLAALHEAVPEQVPDVTGAVARYVAIYRRLRPGAETTS